MIERPRILRVGEELPPLRPARGRQSQATAGGGGKVKGTTQGAKAGSAGRFALLNVFVDASMAALSRAELAVWLVLFRDSRDGRASTAQSDLARRAGPTSGEP